VSTRHHVLDDLRRGVPDAQVPPELGIERLQERLVEVLDGLTLLEPGEELGALDAVQRGAGPLQRLDEVQRGEP
jgi:hypothetical protein